MIIVVCGLIASGKTTFCKSRNDGIVSDRDFMNSKDEQISFTLRCNYENKTVYHITCYPTSKELEAFRYQNVRYIWINTNILQCKKNMEKRGRARDLEDIKDTIKKNKQIYNQYLYSNIDFEVVELFKNKIVEKW